MKIATVADIANLADGSVVGEMTVIIKAVFPPKTGTNKKTGNPWTATSAILQDRSGEVRATFWDMDVQDLKSQRVTLRSQAGKRGLDGIKVKFSDYSNANELSITDKCAIIDDATGAIAASAPAQSASPKASPSFSKPALTPEAAKKVIFNNAKLYVQCVKAVTWISTQVEQMSEAHFQAAVASMFISAEKAGLASAFAEPEKVEVKEEAPKPVIAEEDDDDIKW
jgi:hypothetical protein